MTLHIRIALLTACCLFASFILAQKKDPIRFGKVTAADFSVSSPAIDSASNAVILVDIGTSQMTGNNEGFFSTKYTHFRRVKILNKNGLDAADVAIMLYTSMNDEEKLDECKAITYNLEGGVVQETKLESSSIFKEQLSANAVLRKFTFPNVKEGSIIEYTYTIVSPFYDYLRPWEFQGISLPRIYSKYTVKLPQFFSFVFLAQGYVPLKTEQASKMQAYSVVESNGTGASDRYSLSGYENMTQWVATDVPALRVEHYTSSINNHISKIDFQLKQIQFPQQEPVEHIGSWSKAAEKLLKREDFGYEISRPNNWLTDEIKTIAGDARVPDEITRNIYAFVRDHFTATQHVGVYISDRTTLKDVFRKRSGNVAEINLLLVAMLRHAGIRADPVLISTRPNGWAHDFYPLLSKYNYLICRTRIGGKQVYLDASESKIGFGKLPADCYNGSGFVVSPEATNVAFTPDSLSENKFTLLFLVKDAQKKGLKGSFKTTPGYYESTHLREKLVKESLEDLVKETKKNYSFPVNIEQQFIDSLTRLENPLTFGYKISFDFEDQNIVYLNPMFSEATTKNPFTAATRTYPVEMPYKINETYVLNMEIPEGYQVDEIPKSARVRLNESDGMFEYLIASDSKRITLTSKLSLNRASFAAEDYQSLRDFFGYVTKKHSEVVVLKKIP